MKHRLVSSLIGWNNESAEDDPAENNRSCAWTKMGLQSDKITVIIWPGALRTVLSRSESVSRALTSEGRILFSKGKKKVWLHGYFSCIRRTLLHTLCPITVLKMRHRHVVPINKVVPLTKNV